MKLWSAYNRFSDRNALLLFIITVAMGSLGVMLLGKWVRDGEIPEFVMHIGAFAFLVAVLLTGIGLMNRNQQPKVKNEDQDGPHI